MLKMSDDEAKESAPPLFDELNLCRIGHEPQHMSFKSDDLSSKQYQLSFMTRMYSYKYLNFEFPLN